MSLRKVYIRYKEGCPDSPNTFAAFDGFQQLGIETVPFYGFGDIDTLEDLGPEVGLVGFIGDVWNALKKMGKPIPTPLDYPEELRWALGRKVWRSTLGEMRRSFDPVFIKPVTQKLFTGFVWRAVMGDQIRVVTLADETELWVSDRVEFVSEYRVFVKDGEILDVRRYNGDWSKVPLREIVEGAVHSFKSGPRAYSLDFGVTPEDETLLVEVNDAYALGHYGLNSIRYANLIEARWEELTRGD